MKRKIPLKNYIILLAIALGTIFLVFYLRSWYNTSKEYYQNNSIMSDYLSQLKSDEINSYIIDNPDVVIYYASAKDTTIKSFEKEFRKLMEEYEINHNIIYIDSSKEENSNILTRLNGISNEKIETLHVPNLIYIKEGKVNKILYPNETKINKRDVQNFLIKCEIITND